MTEELSISTSDDERPALDIVLVTGMSGAGRGTLARVLEEFGWYVVDNLPAELIGRMIDLATKPGRRTQRIAIVTDVRSLRFGWRMSSIVEGLKRLGHHPQVIYLDCSDEVLIHRFDQSRRAHPMQEGRSLADAIVAERELLAPVRDAADLIVDTTHLNATKLRERVETYRDALSAPLSISVMSFGFKYGVPLDADFVFDMRFLPNPFWVPELREKDGRDEEVRDYVIADERAETMLEHAVGMITTVAAGYRREGKSHCQVAVGCTGGKHRSVAMTGELVRRLRASGLEAGVVAEHRDLGRE